MRGNCLDWCALSFLRSTGNVEEDTYPVAHAAFNVGSVVVMLG